MTKASGVIWSRAIFVELQQSLLSLVTQMGWEYYSQNAAGAHHYGDPGCIYLFMRITERHYLSGENALIIRALVQNPLHLCAKGLTEGSGTTDKNRLFDGLRRLDVLDHGWVKFIRT